MNNRNSNINNANASKQSSQSTTTSRQETSLEELTKKFLTILMSNQFLQIDLK